MSSINERNKVSDLREYIDQFLDYLDKEEEENRIIIMDNVPFHKASEIRAKIESRSHRLEFLPPYSPFLNPIGEVFSKRKGTVKQNNCQTEDQHLDCIHNASEEIDEFNCTELFSIWNSFLDPVLSEKRSSRIYFSANRIWINAIELNQFLPRIQLLPFLLKLSANYYITWC